jgi:excinuclease ABC subunit C
MHRRVDVQIQAGVIVSPATPAQAGRLPDARCARRCALCGQGARAEEPGDELYAGGAAAATGCGAWSARRAAMTIVTTNSEAEALLLEAQLIKRYRPPYNVLLRDDKSFPFILLRADHAFPRIRSIAARGAPRAIITGRSPAPGRSTPRSMRCRSCSCCGAAPTASSRRDRPCLLYQIKRCSAPCVGRIDEAGYAELVRQAKDFLGGKSTAVQRRSRRRWPRRLPKRWISNAPPCCATGCARDLHPGQPGDQRRRRGQCRHLRDGQPRAGRSAVQAFFIRGGQNWGHRAFFPSHTEGLTRRR